MIKPENNKTNGGDANLGDPVDENKGKKVVAPANTVSEALDFKSMHHFSHLFSF